MQDEQAQSFLKNYANLPGGCDVYQIDHDGNVWHAGNNQVQKVESSNPLFANALHLFINPGNQALYLLGNPQTSADNPTNATAKLGIMEPHHHFEPHAHGVQHFVFSAGYTGCRLYDDVKKQVVEVDLQPLSIIDIKPGVPHAFFNRDESKPAVILVANGGLGIEHSEYAVTLKQARERVDNTLDLKKHAELGLLIEALKALDESIKQGIPSKHFHEKIADFLETLGERVRTIRPASVRPVSDRHHKHERTHG